MIATDPVWQLAPQYAAEAEQAGLQARAWLDKNGNALAKRLQGSDAESGGPNPNDPWFGRELTEPEIQQFTKESTHLGTNKVTVLGHMYPPGGGPSYIQAAEEQGASYFNMPTNLVNGLTTANQWELNKQFLRDAVARGDKIIVGTEINYQNPGSWLFREIDFLKLEYNLVLQGNTFVPGPTPGH
jgi:hypothetical protein